MTTQLLDQLKEFLEKQEMLSTITEHRELQTSGYSLMQVHTLAVIGITKNPNVTSIAQALRMTKGAISKITKYLLSEELIETYTFLDNKQKIFFQLTSKGQFIYDEHEKRHQLWIKRDQEFIQKFPKEDIDVVYKFMVSFNEYLEDQIDILGGEKNVD